MVDETTSPISILNRQTGITIGLGILVLGASVSAAWWFGQWTGADKSWKSSTDDRLESIEHAIEKVRIEGGANRWSSVDMIRWTGRLQKNNPELKVPEPLTR